MRPDPRNRPRAKVPLKESRLPHPPRILPPGDGRDSYGPIPGGRPCAPLAAPTTRTAAHTAARSTPHPVPCPITITASWSTQHDVRARTDQACRNTPRGRPRLLHGQDHHPPHVTDGDRAAYK
eukprot:scaffold32223_cov107-Isochrysis_galbana.AAC.4